jgi:phosphatidate cytidylyltransferase
VPALPDPAPSVPAPPPAAKGGWRDLRARVLSALLLAPLAVGCIAIGGPVFALLIAAGAVGVGLEWGAMLRLPRRSLRGTVFALWPSLCGLAGLTGRWTGVLPMLIAGLVLGPDVAVGLLVIGLAVLSLFWLRFMTGAGMADVLFVILVVWASDSFAYLTGRLVGGPKLAPRISPGKTWSGSLGGLAAGCLVGAVVAAVSAIPDGEPVAAAMRGILFGGLLAIVSQAGDLAESALKRRCGVKDSGSLIPGHGGLLDRFDGLLAAAPVAALLSFATPFGDGLWMAGRSPMVPPVDGQVPAWVMHDLFFLLPSAEDRRP